MIIFHEILRKFSASWKLINESLCCLFSFKYLECEKTLTITDNSRIFITLILKTFLTTFWQGNHLKRQVENYYNIINTLSRHQYEYINISKNLVSIFSSSQKIKRNNIISIFNNSQRFQIVWMTGRSFS